MSLFLKYRPQTFSDLVGQEAVRRTLQNALKAERPSHAYLFTGSRGTGKTSTARIFAKGLNCENLQDGDPCGTCRFCTGTADGTLVDVIEIDAASNRGIDEIRDLREKINFAPNVAPRKVYIIDEVHMMTKEAFNALLKTLEEPPDHAFFCLATTEIHKVPETIRSRCQTFSFQRFTLEQLVERLQYIAENENIAAEPQALDLIARKAEGGLRDAISLLEQVAAETENQVTKDSTSTSLGVSDTQTLQNLMTALQSGDSQTGLDVLRHLSQNGLDFRSFGHDFLGYLREQMLGQLGTDQIGFTLKCIEEFEIALQRLKTSPIIELPLEIAIINLTQNTQQSAPAPATPIAQPTPPAAPEPPKQKAPEPPKVAAQPEPAPEPKPEPTPKPEPELKVQKEPSTINHSPSTSSDDGFIFDGDPAPAPNQNNSADALPQGEMPAGQSGVEEGSSSPNSQPPTPNSPLDGAALNAQMEAIALKAGIPVFAKKSFLTCTPKVEGNIITFATSSEFHREKIDQNEVKNALLSAINTMFDVSDFQLRVVKSGDATPTPAGQKASVDDFLDF